MCFSFKESREVHPIFSWDSRQALFGVLDNDLAQKYLKDIQQITRNQNHLRNIYKNMTSVIDLTAHILQSQETKFADFASSVRTNIESLRKVVNEISDTAQRSNELHSLIKTIMFNCGSTTALTTCS